MGRRGISVLLAAGIVAAVAACSQSPEDARKELASQGISFNEREFLVAVRGGDKETVKLLLEGGMGERLNERRLRAVWSAPRGMW